MRAGALVSPCHVMAGLVPAIHVFARSSTDLAERDARNKSGHDERSGRTGETARLTHSHANFRIGTLARLSNQGCGLRGDFWPHREGNGLPPATKGRPAPPMGDGRPFSSHRGRLSHKNRTAQRRGQVDVGQCAPKAPVRRPTVVELRLELAGHAFRNVPFVGGHVGVELRLPLTAAFGIASDGPIHSRLRACYGTVRSFLCLFNVNDQSDALLKFVTSPESMSFSKSASIRALAVNEPVPDWMPRG